MMRDIFVGALTAAVMIAAGTMAAEAQQVLTDPAAIRGCLCERQTMTALHDQVGAQRQNYEASRQALAAIDNRLKTQRAHINVYNDEPIDAYKQLLAQRDKATSAVDAATHAYDAAVSRYNPVISDYNEHCAGKSFDAAALKTAEATLACPKP